MTAISEKCVRDALDSTNLNGATFPWPQRFSAGQFLKRWIALPITVDLRLVADDEHRKLAIAAIDEVELHLKPVGLPRALFMFGGLSVGEPGLVFSFGTAAAPEKVPQKHNCGNVSAGPHSTAYPPGFLKLTGEISAQFFINVGSPHNDGCKPSRDIAIHEIGHALGLGDHFQGFGEGPIISDLFWCVLETLYANPIGPVPASSKLTYHLTP